MVLFVTSFTPQLFEATGRRLVESFRTRRCPGRLLICHEAFPSGKSPVSGPGLLSYRLDRDALLAAWQSANRDIIPIRFGGAATRCGCPEPDNPFSPHRPRCHGAWFNHHASRWFRKIAALRHAMSLTGYESVIWLDCDCVLTHPIPQSEIRRWFAGHAVFYLKSPDRRVLESGLLGIRCNAAGRTFLASTVEHFRSGAFRKNSRWDDGYQFQLTLRRHREIPAIDLAESAIGGKHGHVVPCSPAGDFLQHHKGANAGPLGWI